MNEKATGHKSNKISIIFLYISNYQKKMFKGFSYNTIKN